MKAVANGPNGRIAVLLFGTYRDLASTRRLEMELSPGATVADVLMAVEDRLGSLAPAPAVAVNRVLSGLDRAVVADDEVAFLPPVAGG